MARVSEKGHFKPLLQVSASMESTEIIIERKDGSGGWI
jgi:hypothetical protein